MESCGRAGSSGERPGPAPRAGAVWRLGSVGPGRGGPWQCLVAGLERTSCYPSASGVRGGLPDVARL
eukprot:11469338-Alexandrium_andersonii.AAC.1